MVVSPIEASMTSTSWLLCLEFLKLLIQYWQMCFSYPSANLSTYIQAQLQNWSTVSHMKQPYQRQDSIMETSLCFQSLNSHHFQNSLRSAYFHFYSQTISSGVDSYICHKIILFCWKWYCPTYCHDLLHFEN